MVASVFFGNLHTSFSFFIGASQLDYARFFCYHVTRTESCGVAWRAMDPVPMPARSFLQKQTTAFRVFANTNTGRAMMGALPQVKYSAWIREIKLGKAFPRWYETTTHAVGFVFIKSRIE